MFATHQSSRSPGASRPASSPALMVEPLEPRRLLAKVAPLEIEHFTVSPTLDTLEKDLRAATEAFLARVPGAVVQSTHRPYEYQEHFRELRDKYVELLAQPGISQSGGTLEVTGSEGEENRALVDQVNADLRGHGIARQGPDFVPSVSKPERSRHTELPATAVDIGPRGSGTLAGLPYSEIDKIAKEVGLYRPYKSTDVVHFELIPSDTAFVIDATGSMSDDIAAVKAQASTIINRVFEQDERARVSVVLYKDAGDDFVARTVLGFTSDQAAINSAIQSISVDGGGDFPEAVYAGLMQAIRNAGEWNGGKKNIILLGDAPAHDPDEATGDTLASVVAAAKSIGATIGGDASFFASSLAVEGDDEPNGYVDETLEDFTGVPAADGTRPARVYAITVGSDASAIDSFQAIADATGGSYFSAADADEVVAAVLGALEEAATDPDLAPAPVLAEGVLRIEGTVADDVIRVTLVGDTVNVDVNGAITPFAAASVVQVDIFGGAGDDDVILGDGVGYAVVRGGPGNDLLVGGDGPDALYGEAGNDILRGHGGGDLLDGGDGDDDLHGGAAELYGSVDDYLAALA